MTPVYIIAARVVVVIAVAVALTFVGACRAALRIERSRVEHWKDTAERQTGRAKSYHAALNSAHGEIAELRARLAPFIADRPRGEGGRFLSVKKDAA